MKESGNTDSILRKCGLNIKIVGKLLKNSWDSHRPLIENIKERNDKLRRWSKKVKGRASMLERLKQKLVELKKAPSFELVENERMKMEEGICVFFFFF